MSKLSEELPVNQRPREKLLSAGSAAKLSDAELLAILLGSGTKGHNVMSVAGALLRQYKTLAFLSKASIKDLEKIKGIGKVKAVQISAMLEIARRALLSEPDESAFAGNPARIANEARTQCAGMRTEALFVFPLNKKLRRCGPVTLVSQGSIDRVIVHPREVFAVALQWGAASVAIAHNHPSGDPAPSKIDEQMTAELLTAGRALRIPLTDHVIVGDPSTHPPGYYSFHAIRPDMFALD
ncbi:MAG: DNA repair protein RadC [Kiritimatiellaeota bacterium]|nr:DNA repair protein RadC [Kiritimatiellota bacterium]